LSLLVVYHAKKRNKQKTLSMLLVMTVLDTLTTVTLEHTHTRFRFFE